MKNGLSAATLFLIKSKEMYSPFFENYNPNPGQTSSSGNDQSGIEYWDEKVKKGIFDEEFLQFFASKMSKFKEPFFTTLFTISSHNPYIIPEKYKGKFPKGTTKIQESIAYSDYALEQFFKTASKNRSCCFYDLFVRC